jgi:ribosomal protein S18 acetylase RimI-like enzyme
MIRPLRDTDYAVCKDLFQTVFHPSIHDQFPKVWKIRCPSLGLWVHGALIGFALVSGMKLEYICINESQQGCGHGSRLLIAVLSLYPAIHLVPVDDVKVCKWYESHGFHLEFIAERNGHTMRRYVRHGYSLRNHVENM